MPGLPTQTELESGQSELPPEAQEAALELYRHQRSREAEPTPKSWPHRRGDGSYTTNL
jgi:hypothetical protein